MNTSLLATGLAAAAALAGVLLAPVPQDPKQDPADMEAMMKKAEKFTKPGKNHEHLRRFLGRWDTELRFFMAGQAMPPEKGTAETTWLLQDRVVQTHTKGMLMRKPSESFLMMGYDNFKQSFVFSYAQTMDTAMNHGEGDLTQDGRTLICYGTIDEYLTGEHDKMVKYVWRFESDDRIVWEVHDLPIGENHTKVVEVVYTRAK
jgi:hypothetical protein